MTEDEKDKVDISIIDQTMFADIRMRLRQIQHLKRQPLVPEFYESLLRTRLKLRAFTDRCEADLSFAAKAGEALYFEAFGAMHDS